MINNNKRKTRKVKKDNIENMNIVNNERLNEKLSGLMDKLANIMLKLGDGIRYRSYKKAEETILSYPGDITKIEDLKGLPGIGPAIYEKFGVYLQTGTLSIIEREKNKPENVLSDIYGIGPKKAVDLVNNGIKTIEDLRKKQDEVLNNVQKIGLKHYEDTLLRIPRSEIDKYNKIFTSAFSKFADNTTRYEIVGSYRRGASESGDIDVIITSENPIVFKNFIDLLIEKKIITDVLSRGNSKCLVYTILPSFSHYRRVDFLFTNPSEYPFAVLYFTGSKAFNTVMRGHALKLGYSLNEHGMSVIVDKKKEKPVDYVFVDEKSIFDFLHLEYKEPNERIDGRQIIPTSGGIVITNDKIVTKKKVTRKIVKNDIDKNIDKTINNNIEPMKKETNVLSETEVKNMISLFQLKGLSYLENLNETYCVSMLELANQYYRNTNTTLMTDNEYDILEDYIREKYPNNIVLKKIGAKVLKNKVKLPYSMGSMDKIKPDTGALTSWCSKYKGPYVISCKLDGVSGLYMYKAGKPYLYTRGDGVVGQDISYLAKILQLPKIPNDVAIRGEFIIRRNMFNEKYSSKFANARNMVSGIINSKTIDESIKDLHFVAYEIIHPQYKPSNQMAMINQYGLELVKYEIIESNLLTNELLSNRLIDWRQSYLYEIDGVIVCDDNIYPHPEEGNPDYAFAFKMVINDQIAEAKVVDVIWSPSKNGVLKPRVRIEPIRLNGVVIEYATGFNAKFIEDNKIGVGAIIQIIRSGDVIPYIRGIVVPASISKMPDVPYVWNNTHVDIMVENISEDPVVQEKNTVLFFICIGVEGLSTGNIKRIFNAGFTSIPSILKMTKEDFAKVEGFKEKMIEKIYGSIKESISKVDLFTIMVASNKLGKNLGAKKLKPIIDSFPNILVSPETPSEKMMMLKTIKGIGNENATEFVNSIPSFLNFLIECDLQYLLNSKTPTTTIPEIKEEINQDTSHPLFGKKIVMTKIRDKEIINILPKFGASLEDNIKKDTYILIVKSKEDKSNKTEFAEKNNILIMTPDEFKAKFM
jgi:NAD-dependent DNA ligase/DNA polymerase/3'-5' exonuclease PolX